MSTVRLISVIFLLGLVAFAGLAVGTDAVHEQPDGAADPPSEMQPVPEPNTTEYLAIPSGEIEREGFERGELDVAAAVSGDVGATKADYISADLQRSLRTAETQDDRRAAVERAAERSAARVEALEQRERQAVIEYGNGARDGTSLLRTLVAADTEARALDDTIVEIHEANDGLNQPPTTVEELASLRTRLIPLQGPVRSQLGMSVSGDADDRVFVETRGGDVTLASIDAGWYVREAHYRDGRDLDGFDQLGFSGAEQRYGELYPWTFNNSGPTNYGTIAGQPFYHHAHVYDVAVGHAHGSGSTTDLITYLDGFTANVFVEQQRKDPTLVPTDTLETESDDEELRLLVNTTRAGGPLGVAVVDESTDELVDANVELNDVAVGSTGGETLWTVAPRGDVQITATHAGETLTVETRLE